MPAYEVATKIKTALQEIKTSDLDNPQLIEVLQLAEQLVDSMKMFFSSLDQSVHSEFRYIGEYIARTRDEIAELRPNDIRRARLPTAGAELDAVVSDTEVATDAIMHETEQVMELEPVDLAAYKDQVDAAMMRIIEACSFQDITGQRVSKVVTTLQHIEERIARFANVMGVSDADAPAGDAKDAWRRDNLLNGPAIGGPANSQDAINKLFDEGDASDLGQDAIDKLFD